MELTINDLSKEYGRKKAVNHFSAKLTNGVYGLLGANGAGKTTLIRLVLGLANPTSGNFEFFGGMNNYKARARIGNLIESPAIYPNMTGQQNLTIFCKMLGVNEEKIPELLKLLTEKKQNISDAVTELQKELVECKL